MSCCGSGEAIRPPVDLKSQSENLKVEWTWNWIKIFPKKSPSKNSRIIA